MIIGTIFPISVIKTQAKSKTIERSEKSNMKKIQISSSKCILSGKTRNP